MGVHIASTENGVSSAVRNMCVLSKIEIWVYRANEISQGI
jgi:hypothetical protein